MDESATQPTWQSNLLGAGMFAALIGLIPLIALLLAWDSLRFRWLVNRARRTWPANRRTLVVYSDSPYWQQYFEEKIIPKVRRKVWLLNWSKRREWDRRQLPVQLALARARLSSFGLEGSTPEWAGRAWCLLPFASSQRARQLCYDSGGRSSRPSMEILSCWNGGSTNSSPSLAFHRDRNERDDHEPHWLDCDWGSGDWNH